MKNHPAALMLISWLTAFAIFFILPFRLESREMTLYGYLILSIFLAVFCAGALFASRPMPQSPRAPGVAVNFQRADRVLLAACVLAALMFMLDIQGRNVLDLAAAYQARSGRADDLLKGAASDSTIWFQIGFLLYPAGYVYLVREIAYRPRPLAWKVAAFGMFPVILASLSMGGRGPLVFVVVFAVYAFALRKQVFPTQKPVRRSTSAARRREAPLRPSATARRRPHFRLGAAPRIAMGFVAAIAMFYVVQVFITRADASGGVDAIFGAIGLNWGVSFNGRFSGLFYALFGVEGTYLIFVFAWYAIQGAIMSNAIFTNYEGPMLMGTYGIDLISAAMRRINGEYVADGFDRLLQMNVYGFVPSAFGSLYVDFKFFGLIPCLAWGWLCGLVYRKVKTGADPRYLMLVPLISLGIVFSLINTPLGLSNGLMLHFWFLVVFVLSTTNAGPGGTPRPTRPQPRTPGFAQ